MAAVSIVLIGVSAVIAARLLRPPAGPADGAPGADR